MISESSFISNFIDSNLPPVLRGDAPRSLSTKLLSVYVFSFTKKGTLMASANLFETLSLKVENTQFFKFRTKSDHHFLKFTFVE